MTLENKNHKCRQIEKKSLPLQVEIFLIENGRKNRKFGVKVLGNIIWFVFGGFIIAIEYLIASLLLMITIIGIPFGLQSLKLATVALFPFGKKVVQSEASSSCLSLIMNIIWFFVGGVWIMLTHLLFGILFYITIVGIPFGNQHFKLMKLAFSPFGKTIV